MHSIPYYKTMILIGFPFEFCVLLAIFWIGYKLLSTKKRIIFESFLISTSITFFYFQSTVLNSLANLLSCTKIENTYYLTNYLLVKCDGNADYGLWRNFVIIPLFTFFSIVLTSLPFIYMFNNRKNLYCDNVLRKVGFLLNGYSKKYFYW